MLKQFKGFIGYSEEEFKELWKSAIFVVDTNILINFYKYNSKESSKSLLDILKKLKENERLWIPHQVALEYFFNYEDDMYKQNEGYELLGSELSKLKNIAKKALSTVKTNHPYIMTENFQFLLDELDHSNKEIQKKISEEINNLPDSSAIQQDLMHLLDGITGEPFTQEKINEIEEQGKERYKHHVPPGFKDREDDKKQAYRSYGNFKYQQLYGDLIIWNQILAKAKNEENPTSIILITEDRKEDWWEKDGQRIKRPHPYLIQEFLNKTQQNFYMYRTDNFVKNAMKYLLTDITDEQFQEVTIEVEHIRKVEDLKNEKTNNREQIDISIVLEYLIDSEKTIFHDIVRQSMYIDNNDNQANSMYSSAMKFAIASAVPRMENELQDLIIYLSTINKEKGHQAQHLYHSLPENFDERVTGLIEQLKLIKDTIEFYSVFTSGHI